MVERQDDLRPLPVGDADAGLVDPEDLGFFGVVDFEGLVRVGKPQAVALVNLDVAGPEQTQRLLILVSWQFSGREAVVSASLVAEGDDFLFPVDVGYDAFAASCDHAFR